MSKFKVGDKVVPHSKTAGYAKFKDSQFCENSAQYITIVNIEGAEYLTKDNLKHNSSERYNESDLTLYQEPSTTTELTELPKNWCIKVDSGCENYPDLYRWRGSIWTSSGYIHNDYYKMWYETPKYTEITTEQFKKWVLKGDTVKPKFEVGKWYQDSRWSTEQDYAKCTEFAHDTIYFDERIHKGKYAKRSSGWGMADKNLREVTLEEIQEYLPDGHPDRFDNVPPITMYVPKLGDWVKLTRSSDVQAGKIISLGDDYITLHPWNINCSGAIYSEGGSFTPSDCIIELLTLEEREKLFPVPQVEIVKPSETATTIKEDATTYSTSTLDSSDLIEGSWYEVLDTGVYKYILFKEVNSDGDTAGYKTVDNGGDIATDNYIYKGYNFVPTTVEAVISYIESEGNSAEELMSEPYLVKEPFKKGWYTIAKYPKLLYFVKEDFSGWGFNHNRDWKTFTDVSEYKDMFLRVETEDANAILLEYAALKYTIGVCYIGLNGDGTVGGFKRDATKKPRLMARGIDVGCDYVYCITNGKWAELVSQEKTVEKPIGKYMEAIYNEKNPERGARIIKYLESRGGINKVYWEGTAKNAYWYIDSAGLIQYIYSTIPEGYTENTDFEPTTMTAPTIEKPWTPSVGDYITITKSKINWDHSTMDDLIGETYKVTRSNGDSINFKGDRCNQWNYTQKHFRQATPEEILSVTSSQPTSTITIAPEQKGEVVHCTTQEEWDTVLSVFNPRNLTRKWEKDCNCLVLENQDPSGKPGTYSPLQWFIDKNYHIISFENWCARNGVTPKTSVFPVKELEAKIQQVETYPDYIGACVHCETQEQWDIITNTLGIKWGSGRWNIYEELTTVHLGDTTGLSNWYWALENNYLILSFVDWCIMSNVTLVRGVSVENETFPKASKVEGYTVDNSNPLFPKIKLK